MKIEDANPTHLPPHPRITSQTVKGVQSRLNFTSNKFQSNARGSDDEDERPLMIDEKKIAKPAKIGQNEHRGPIKIRLSGKQRALLKEYSA